MEDSVSVLTLTKLFDHPTQALFNADCWTIPEMTIPIPEDKIQAIIDAGIFPKLFELLKVEQANIQKEAAWMVYKTIQYGTPKQVRYLIDEGVIMPLCNISQGEDLEVIALALGGLEKLLQLDRYDYNLLENFVKALCHENGGMEAIERWKGHPNTNISEIAKSILDLTFGKHLNFEDPSHQLSFMQYYRKVLTIESNRPMRQVINSGVLPSFVRFLQIDEAPVLQYEAAWTITNIAASDNSEYTQYLVEAGVVPILIRLLSSTSDDVRAQAAWALGNIAGDKDLRFRDIVLAAGALPALLETAKDCNNETSKIEILTQISFAVSVLSRDEPLPDLRPALPLLSRLLLFKVEEIVENACFTLSQISAENIFYIDDILQEDLNIVPRLMELLVGSTSPTILDSALEALRHISSGDERHTQSLLVTLPLLLWFLDYPDKDIRWKVCWILSNITAGTEEQIQAVIDAAIFPKLFEILKSSPLDLQKQATYAVCNAAGAGGATIEQVWYLINEGVIPLLCNLLSNEQINSFGAVTLAGLSAILKIGKMSEKFEDVIRTSFDGDCMDRIKVLQNHEDFEISDLSNEIVRIILCIIVCSDEPF